MSTPVEMAANVSHLPPPPPPPSQKTEGVAREDASAPTEKKPVEDAADVRATRVSMAEDDKQTSANGAPRSGRSQVDVLA
jgi:hypothetical protein